MKFIDQLLDAHSSKINAEAVLLFPSVRGIVEFKRALSNKSEIGWLPECITLSEFLSRFSSSKTANTLQKLHAMHIAVSQVFKNRQMVAVSNDLLSQFITDFEEVQREGVKAAELFKQVTYAKMLEKWQLTPELLGENGKNNVYIWEFLSELYAHYYAALAQQNVSTQAGLIDEVFSNNATKKFIKTKRNVLLVGFSNFNNHEQKLIEFFNQFVSVEVVFDYDDFYLNNPQDIAGIFARKQQQKVAQNATFLSANWEQNKQEVNHYFLNSDLEQITQLYEVLKNTRNGGRVGVVFLDQNLIQTALFSLPQDFSTVNIGVGFQLKNSFLFPLISALLQGDKTEALCAINNVPIISENWVLQTLQFLQGNSSFIEELKILKKQLLKIPIQKWKNPFQIFCEEAISTALVFFEDFIENVEALTSLDRSVLFGQFMGDLGSQSISTISDKNEHIQFLGLLETRGVDFDKVILLSCNEAHLPGQYVEKSFIPFDIRNKFGLSMPQDKEGIKAYYFYQAVQRADQVTCFTLNPDASFNASEVSRYLMQLEKNHSSFMAANTFHSGGFSLDSRVETILKIDSSADGRNRIVNYLTQKGLSPSALNLLIRNPYDFYLQYAVGLKETQVNSGEVAHSELGSLFHHVLEDLYQPLEGKILSIEMMRELSVKKDGLLKNRLEALSEKLNLDAGVKNLYKSIVDVWLGNFLKFDTSRVQKGKTILIESIEEEKLEAAIPITINGKSIVVKLVGKIDRVEVVDGKRVLVDYKTGKVFPADLKLSNFFEDLENTRYSKAVQLLFYSYIYSRKKNVQNPEAGIYSCRSQSAGIMTLQVKDETINNWNTSFVEFLVSKLTEVLDETYVFQKPNEVSSKFLAATT